MNTDNNQHKPELETQPFARLGFGMLFLTFIVLLGWASFAQLNSAVIAQGRITVASDNKIIQHLDGGLVKSIHVRDGDLVEQNQVLLSLNDEPLRLRIKQIRMQLLDLEANRLRLIAEKDQQKELLFPAELLQKAKVRSADNILGIQKQLFVSRRQTLDAEYSVLMQRQLQIQKQLEGSKKLIASLNHRLSLLKQDQQAIQKLAAKKMASDSDLRNIENTISSLRGEIISEKGDISRLMESLSESKYSSVLRKQQYQEEVITELRELHPLQFKLQTEETDILGQLGRIDIRAPIAGKVKGFHVVTIGAVIDSGQNIMEIVPLERQFKIQAQISPLDIDAIFSGMNAEVRFNAFESAQNFDSLYADLVDVSTDIYQGKNNDDSYYKATLLIDENSIGILKREQLKLVSGMSVDVIVKTGDRTLVDYLIKPLSMMMSRAFNET